MGKIIDLVGKRFSRLTVICKSNIKKKYHATYWTCKCDCGKIKDIYGGSLRQKKTHSCGCLIAESNTLSAKHNMCKTSFYHTWAGIKERTTNKKQDSYKNYGGRGIKLCKKWYDFLEFKNDMYTSYLYHVKKFGKKNTKIERIDNDDGYNNKNCKWATNHEQARNQRTNVYIEFNNERMILEDWANRININSSSLCNRLKKLNWTIEKALTTPSRGNWKSKIEKNKNNNK